MFTPMQQARPRAGGRLPQREPISQAEAKRRAHSFLVSPPSELLLKTWQLLCTAGVLTVAQLGDLAGVAPRTLRKYAAWHLLDRLPDRHEQLQELGLTGTPEELRLYCLGDVGVAMAEEVGQMVPRGYVGPKDRVTHDLLANEVIRRVGREAEERGWTWRWASRYEATLYRDKKPIVEPDGMLVLRHPEKGQRVALLELHNEDSARRVATKLYRYEEAVSGRGVGADSLDPWLGEGTPLVLVVCTHGAPFNAYNQALREKHERHDRVSCHWRGLSWYSLVDYNEPNLWLHFATDEVVDILT